MCESVKAHIKEMIRMGTSTLEIKSGHGLTMESEMKMLRVIECLKETLDIPIKATFLGAHAHTASVQGTYRDTWIAL